MSELEDVVAAFLDAREADPRLSAPQFLSGREDAAPGALDAIHRALELEELFRDDAPSHVTALPPRLADHVFVRELGAGGMGRVLEVARGGERFALKLLHETTLIDTRAITRFRREAETLARLDHRGIVRVVDNGADERPPWLLMEIIDGRPLSECEGPMEPRRAARIVRDLARAVAAAHAEGLLHRDIKPSNVILRPDDEPVLLDFGMASVEDGSTLTRTGDQLGTPRYMAPEQVRGLLCDARTDVHALGLVLFELLTGRAARPQDSRAGVLGAALRGTLEAPSSSSPATPRALDRIVLTAAAWRPRHRHESAAELARDLDRFLDGREPHARPPGPLTRAAAAASEHRVVVVLCTIVLAAAVVAGFGLGKGASASEAEVERAFDRGLAAWAEGHEVRAASLLDELRRLAPDDARTSRLAELLRPSDEAGSTDRVVGLMIDARRELERGRLDAAFKFARQAALALPESVQAARLVASSASAPDDLEWARTWLARLAESRPESVAAAGANGKILRRLGRVDAAEQELRRGIAIDPEAAVLHHELAILLHGSGRTGEAAAAAREAARLTRGESRAVLNNLAAFLDQIGESDEAIGILRDLTVRHPTNFKVWYNLAFALDRQGRVAEARPLYEKCLEFQPGQLDASLCLAWLLATATDAEVRDVDRAFEILGETRRHHGASSPKVARLIAEVERLTGRTLDR